MKKKDQSSATCVLCVCCVCIVCARLLCKTTKSDGLPFLFLSQPSHKAPTVSLLKIITLIFSLSVGLHLLIIYYLSLWCALREDCWRAVRKKKTTKKKILIE